MSADPVLGPMGEPMAADTGVLLADADAAATLEQVRWARAACVITRGTGTLLRGVDLGHFPEDDMWYDSTSIPGTRYCSVCGQAWPCPSSRLERSARFGPSAVFMRDCVHTDPDGTMHVEMTR